MNWQIDRWRRVLLLGCLVTGWCTFFSADQASGRDHDQISLPAFRRVVAEFMKKHEVPQNEIISQRDVAPLLGVLTSQGMILDLKELMQMIPGDESSLVRLLRTPNGRKFIGQTMNNKMMFDRLDRIANEPGGKRLLRDLMKLPDAARYAKIDPGPGIPDLIDFLPKLRSSKTRRVKDYKKPTGKLYTMNDVVEYLAKQISSPQKRGSAADK
jgi:hypothetical protein